ncbi:MAG: cyclic nucleotide-binding domain-containing protein [Pseudomonadota bacterium]
MSLNDTVRVLSAMALFSPLDEQRLRVVALSGQPVTYEDGERLWEKDDPGPYVVIVLEGTAEILLPTNDGGETAITTLGPGEVVGEMAVLTGARRSTAVAARGTLRLLRLEGEVLIELLTEFPALALQLCRVLAQRIEATNAKLAVSGA